MGRGTAGKGTAKTGSMLDSLIGAVLFRLRFLVLDRFVAMPSS